MNIEFNDFVFGDYKPELWYHLYFIGCTFNNVSINSPISILEDYAQFYETEYMGVEYNENKFNNISLPNIDDSSWTNLPRNRIPGTPITFRTNLYIELDRICNANCVFCRNQSFERCNFDFRKIKKILKCIRGYVNDVVIGGGEPTLKTIELLALKFQLYKMGVDSYVFTNGSADIKTYKRLLDEYVYNFNISRHAIDDEENASIFGYKRVGELNSEKLSIFTGGSSKNTLCATCIKGALDSHDKIIQYIKWAQSLGFSRVMFSDLHKDSSMGEITPYDDNLTIDKSVFESAMQTIQKAGFVRKIPIYSTGGYTSTVLTNGKFSIVFKSYITKKELEENWPSALKRTFDLSIAPNGDLYQNWSQTSGKVLLRK